MLPIFLVGTKEMLTVVGWKMLRDMVANRSEGRECGVA